MNNNYQPHVLGRKAEDGACEYLKKQGLKLITRNYCCRLGEIDLIMRDGKILVFIEVRLRSNLSYGTGLESVTRSKQQKIIRAAEYYLLINHLTYKVSCRFDIVSATFKEGKFDFSWIKHAFENE
ncbi:MAG: YraN family protein [Gammaproteobacteria bacterium]|nr:YraN family protein [Gammaproteobacteria bacterium]